MVVIVGEGELCFVLVFRSCGFFVFSTWRGTRIHTSNLARHDKGKESFVGRTVKGRKFGSKRPEVHGRQAGKMMPVEEWKTTEY
jgi:hypothetical protein